jgi:uncharacterized membrane protein
MNQFDFLRQLESELKSLPLNKRRKIVNKYRKLIDNAIELGRHPQEFVSSLGTPRDIAVSFGATEIGETFTTPVKPQLKEALGYLITGIIVLAIYALIVGAILIAGNLFQFGISGIIRHDLTPALIALYVGHMVASSGILVIIIGTIIKYQGFVKGVAERVLPRYQGVNHE